MANTNSSQMATLATNGGATETQLMGGRIRIASGIVEIADGDFDANDDTLVLCRIPSNANVTRLELWNDDLDSGTDSIVNIGLYPAGNTTAADAVDEALFGTLVTDFRSLSTVWADYRYETLDTDTTGDKLWQLLGLTSDPTLLYDLVITQTAAVSADIAAGIAFRVEYVVD